MSRVTGANIICPLFWLLTVSLPTFLPLPQIGKSAARALALVGWNVVITGRREAALKAAGEEIQAAIEASGSDKGAKVAYQVGDATREADVVALFDEVVKAHGRVDLVFCNAGISPPACLLEDLPLSDWQAAVNTNLTGGCASTGAERSELTRIQLTDSRRSPVSRSLPSQPPSSAHARPSAR